MNMTKLSPAGMRPGSSPLIGYIGALLLVMASTLAGHGIARNWGSGAVVLLYILPVLVTATYSGLWPAIAAACASTLAFNYYFTAPYHTLLIDSPSDIVTVLVLFIVAIVTSQLAAKLREQTLLAAANAARNATIAGFARRLLICANEQDIANVAVTELSRLFGCNAALLKGAYAPQLIATAPSEIRLAPSDFAAAAATLSTGEPAGRGVCRLDLADWQFRPIVSDQAVTAAIGLAREDGLPPVADDQLALLGNLLDQVALALERARLDREARQLAALHERDKIRSALLCSIGEDVKPRLNAIASAARTLKRAGNGDGALLSDVTAEVAKLDRYIDNLVDVSPGSDRQPIELGAVVIDLFHRTVRKNGDEVRLTPKEYDVLAELAKHAGRVLTHVHLLRVVWGPAQQEQIEYLRVAIRSLRQKLEYDPAKPALIINEPAVGYRIVTG